MLKFNSADDCRKFMVDNDIRQFDVKFCDLVGCWHHITLMKEALDSRILEKGIGFDSSSIPRFRDVRQGDMSARPDLSACFIDPTWEEPTLSAVADIVEAGSGDETSMDPRTVLKRAVEYLRETGIADDFMCMPELEFYLFQHANFKNDPYTSWLRMEAPGIGQIDDNSEMVSASQRIREGNGYLIAAPQDVWQNERAEMASKIALAGLPIRYHHLEVGAAGQQEIEFGFSPAVKAADGVLLGKYIIRSVAGERGIEACFMPKPIPGAAGNGLHIHFRLIKDKINIFADGNNYGGLSQIGVNFLAGVLSHGRAIMALLCGSTNSYKRLRPGHETPIRFFYSIANREAAIRIPKYSTGTHTRCEFRPGDATMNPYLAFAALLMAGIDGVKRKLDPSVGHFGPFDGNPPDIDPQKFPDCFLPRIFSEALIALENDNGFLQEGNVFHDDLIKNYIRYKRDEEIYPLSGWPHPLEYELYWGV